jgi:hypothetical protein
VTNFWSGVPFADASNWTNRFFESGAKRDSDAGKLNFAGYLSPRVLKRFAEYMLKHQTMRDGSARAADDWKSGMPRQSYKESMWRHFFDVWCHLDGTPELAQERDPAEALCALLFNTQGLMHEVLLGRDVGVEVKPKDVHAKALGETRSRFICRCGHSYSDHATRCKRCACQEFM